MLVKAETMAIEMINSAIKECNNLNIEPTKDNAKELLLFKLLSIKQGIVNTTILDNVPLKAIDNTLNYYNKISSIIENY